MDPKPLVHIIEDDAFTSQALSRLLGSVNLETRQYSSPHQFLQEFAPAQPGCILIDVRLPGMSGLELQDQIRSRGWNHAVIFITGHGDVATAVRAMKAGAVDFVQKPFNEQSLVETVLAAVQAHMEQFHIQQRLEHVRQRVQLLSPREREVLGMVVSGKPTKQIAAELGLSHKTVDNHRASILDKMEASGVVELVRMVLLARPDLAQTESPPTPPSFDRPFMSKAS